MIRKEALLPIGTVVIVNGFEVNDVIKKIMIFGRKQLQSSTGALFDYVACLYPEGNISSAYNVFFNHEDISRIIFKGYEDSEERAFRASL